MELSLQIKMNDKLFLRNPEETAFGREIILKSIVLIHKSGFESFTFKKLAEKKGFINKGELNPTIKATEITNWLKEEFQLGHGHAMAIYATLKGKKE